MDLHTSCPHCGNRLSENTPYLTSCPSSAHTPKDELALLNKEVGRLDDMIRQLQRRRSMVLNRVNAMQAPTCALPAEVLSQIFLYACPRVEPCKKPSASPDIAPSSVLTAVCSHWRQVATSTPELWATVSLCIVPSTIHSNMAFLKNSFKHAKRYPMSLDLNLVLYEPEDDEDETPLPDHLVLEPLHEHADRIRSLQIHAMPIHWMGAIQWHRFSALIELRLHWAGYKWKKVVHNKPFSLPNTIQELSIRQLPGDVASQLIPPTGITSLHLGQTRIDQCVRLLTQCPNLLEFSSVNMMEPYPYGTEPNITGIITMAHLEELRWEWIESSWSDAFIRHFQFPVLRKLRWKGLRSTPENLPLEAFCSNLPTTMTKLDILFGSGPSSEDIASSLLRIFRYLPGVVELGIETCSLDGRNDYITASAEGVLKALRMETSGDANNEDTILPSLKVLHWMTKKPRDTYSQSLDRPFINAPSLVQMLLTRRKLGLEFFKLIWGGAIKSEANQNHKESVAELDQLFASGLKIESIQKWYGRHSPCDK